MNVTIKGNSVRYKDGINIKEHLSQDLDEGLLIVPQSLELDIESLDQVVITEGSYTKNMLVSDLKRITSKYSAPKEYNYMIWLTSPTIQLQRIVLPNRSVTQPLTGPKIDIYTIFSNYVNLYSNYTISSALQTLITGVDCAEFQWNRPTLFEVLNDLLSTVDAYVTMRNFTEIDYIDINPSGTAITEVKDEVEVQFLKEYANKLECEVENAVIKKKNISSMEWYALKTTQDAIVTDDNPELILEKPIYKVNKLIARISPDGFTTVYEADLTDYIVEKTRYEQLYPSNSVGFVTGDYKRDKIYYEEGSQIIKGFAYREDTFLGISSKASINNIFRNAYLAQQSVDIGASLNNNEVLRYAFKIDYQALETVKFTSNRKGLTHNSTLINNQTTSYVDYEAFSRKQQQTINRLGNKILEINGEYTLSTMPELGDTRNTDYILAIKEYSIYNNARVVLKGTCSKNYALKNMLTGVKTKQRYEAIAKGNDALECNHITEYDFNLSKTNASTSATIENYFLKFGLANENIKVVQFQTNNMLDPAGLAPSVYYNQKSINLTFKAYDNYSLGPSVDTTLNFTGTRLGINYLSYVNSIGNYASHSYKLYKAITNSTLNLSPQPSTSSWLTGLIEAREYPLINTSNLSGLVYQELLVNRYKDNREITVETLQYNFNNDANVGYGYKFFENSPMTFIESLDDDLRVAYSLTETYEDGDQLYKGTIANPANLDITRVNNIIIVYSPDTSIDPSTFASWAVTDASGNIYVWNNGNNDRIYLNKE